MITIPELNSRYIPVVSLGHLHLCHWWRSDSIFYYPFTLINLEKLTPEHLEEYKVDSDTFLLTDSGGFQAIRGQLSFTWEDSLKKQIELKASKIFSFDNPPVKRIVEGQNIFASIEYDEYKLRVEENLDMALIQSKWLKQNYPEKVKDFCYVLHAGTKEMLDYNIELIEKKIGWKNYGDYFGGVSYAIKKSDYIFFTTCAAHAKKWFKDNGYYVHFLGIGSFNKMFILVKFGIDTFDSTNALRGVITWSLNNPTTLDLLKEINKTTFPFVKTFCSCPPCLSIDYNKLLKDERWTDVGRYFVLHNLWQILKLNILLDSLDKTKYTTFVRQNFKINKDVALSLNYIDEIDKVGLELAYDKFKNYIKIDESKQRTLK